MHIHCTKCEKMCNWENMAVDSLGADMQVLIALLYVNVLWRTGIIVAQRIVIYTRLT